MPNRYANLIGSKKISEDFNNINIGFDRVQAEMDANKDTTDKHIADKDIHVTKAKKDEWDSKAPGSTQTDLKAHTDNADIHVTKAKKAEWDSKAAGALQGTVDTHIADKVAHLTKDEHEKLTKLKEGGEANQNAFSKVNDIGATNPSDSITIKNGTGIKVTTNVSTKEVTITATGEATPGPHGESHDPGGADPIPALVALVEKVDSQDEDIQQAAAQANEALAKAQAAQQAADAAQATADAAETPTGAQTKADQALKDAKAHTTTVTDNMNKDYVRFSGWGGTTGGTDDVFTLSITPGITINEGFGVSFIADRDHATPGLKINQFIAYKVVTDVESKKPVPFKKGRTYTVRFSGGYFLLDSGSASGGGAAIPNSFEATIKRMWNFQPGEFVRAIPEYDDDIGNRVEVYPGNTATIYCAKISYDGNWMFLLEKDGYNSFVISTHQYDYSKRNFVKKSQIYAESGYTPGSQTLECTPNGKVLFVGNKGNSPLLVAYVRDNNGNLTKTNLPSTPVYSIEQMAASRSTFVSNPSFHGILVATSSTLYLYNVSIANSSISVGTIDVQPSGTIHSIGGGVRYFVIVYGGTPQTCNYYYNDTIGTLSKNKAFDIDYPYKACAIDSSNELAIYSNAIVNQRYSLMVEVRKVKDLGSKVARIEEDSWGLVLSMQVFPYIGGALLLADSGKLYYRGTDMFGSTTRFEYNLGVSSGVIRGFAMTSDYSTLIVYGNTSLSHGRSSGIIGIRTSFSIYPHRIEYAWNPPVNSFAIDIDGGNYKTAGKGIIMTPIVEVK
ncbi:hypothetical protein [Paenibacillus azoreducens]|uniref:Uncharacterized protein n=1 Tax=Paenibacillus azoreducens TaxID=116718 RepID=A0A920CWN8_9BACL|nr:hypothetical protein [Paenibacillus azoreducens]GIO51568.1 hypothetical protein J34TS1_63330 [Paenibacillus azoreducens]